MRPDNRDLGLLWDMNNAAREIVELTQGLSYQQFESQILKSGLNKQCFQKQIRSIVESSGDKTEDNHQDRCEEQRGFSVKARHFNFLNFSSFGQWFHIHSQDYAKVVINSDEACD